jgi:hypothetical protein
MSRASVHRILSTIRTCDSFFIARTIGPKPVGRCASTVLQNRNQELPHSKQRGESPAECLNQGWR